MQGYAVFIISKIFAGNHIQTPVRQSQCLESPIRIITGSNTLLQFCLALLLPGTDYFTTRIDNITTSIIKTIHAVLGGAHLISASKERIRLTIAALKELDVPKLGLCHCTSLPAMSLLAQEFGDKFFFNIVGTIFEAS